MEEAFDYKEIDKEGAQTLETISQAKRFNKWMYETIHPHCSGKILEIGSGIGNISEFFTAEGADITLSDIRKSYCDHLRKRYVSHDVVQLDLVHEDFEKEYGRLLSTFDTIFALNVIEHIEDHELAMANIQKLLRPSGKVVILVPAFQWLYNNFDRELYHFRRYNRQSLVDLLSKEFEVKDSFYFNPVGIAGWFFNGSILKKKEIPSDQMKHFDKLVPIFRTINVFTKQLFGLSVIAVGYKSN